MHQAQPDQPPQQHDLTQPMDHHVPIKEGSQLLQGQQAPLQGEEGAGGPGADEDHEDVEMGDVNKDSGSLQGFSTGSMSSSRGGGGSSGGRGSGGEQAAAAREWGIKHVSAAVLGVWG